MWKSIIGPREQIEAKNRYGTFFLGHPVVLRAALTRGEEFADCWESNASNCWTRPLPPPSQEKQWTSWNRFYKYCICMNNLGAPLSKMVESCFLSRKFIHFWELRLPWEGVNQKSELFQSKTVEPPLFLCHNIYGSFSPGRGKWAKCGVFFIFET